MRNKKISISKNKKSSLNQHKQTSSGKKSLDIQNVIQKINYFNLVIENTIIHAQKYKSMDIISASDLNICINKLEKIFERLINLKKKYKV